MSPLVLGPLLRRVDGTTAAVWVETARSATVTVRLAGLDADDAEVWHTRTFAVHGHHYALVELTGLPTGERRTYEVLVDGEVCWPEAGSRYPASTVATPTDDGPVRLAFGSCRTSVPHDALHHLSHGVDALRTYALGLAEGKRASVGHPRPAPAAGRPGLRRLHERRDAGVHRLPAGHRRRARRRAGRLRGVRPPLPDRLARADPALAVVLVAVADDL